MGGSGGPVPWHAQASAPPLPSLLRAEQFPLATAVAAACTVMRFKKTDVKIHTVTSRCALWESENKHHRSCVGVGLAPCCPHSPSLPPFFPVYDGTQNAQRPQKTKSKGKKEKKRSSASLLQTHQQAKKHKHKKRKTKKTTNSKKKKFMQLECGRKRKKKSANDAIGASE